MQTFIIIGLILVLVAAGYFWFNSQKKTSASTYGAVTTTMIPMTAMPAAPIGTTTTTMMPTTTMTPTTTMMPTTTLAATTTLPPRP